MTDTKQPEALRLDDEWQRKTQREADRQNSAYDHYGMGNTPETVDPLGAKMAAELRRLHAENTTLQQGYDAARLEIESLERKLENYSHNLRVSQASFRKAVEERDALRATVSKDGEYPTLPSAPHRLGDIDLWPESQMRAYVDADRAMRAQAAPIDWSQAGLLMEAAVCAGAHQHIVGTTNWAAAVWRYMAKHSAQAAPTCKECDGTGTVSGSQAHFACPQCKPAPVAQGGAPELTDRQIERGWKDTFSTENPFCPCNLKSFTKAVRWAERAARAKAKEGQNHE